MWSLAGPRCSSLLRGWAERLNAPVHAVALLSPGSSIGAVHVDARAIYRDCLALLSDLVSRAGHALTGAPRSAVQLTWPSSSPLFAADALAFVASTSPAPSADSTTSASAVTPAVGVTVFNTVAVARSGVIEVPFAVPGAALTQTTATGHHLSLVTLPGMGAVTLSSMGDSPSTSTDGTVAVSVTAGSDGAGMGLFRALGLVPLRCAVIATLVTDRVSRALVVWVAKP